MKVKYTGVIPIKFVSIGSYTGILKPNDEFELSDDIYNAEYKDDNRFEAGTKKKVKGAE